MQPAASTTPADAAPKPTFSMRVLLARADVASLLLGFILMVWIVYAALFIYLTSAVVDGVRYFLLFDDEMISMRYAANLAHGYGLVWNPHGARVEGFTNPLWVLIMAGLHLLPVSLAKMSLLVQILGAALRLATILIVWRLALVLARSSRRNSRMVALCAVFFTAFYYPLNDWSLRGSEVALLAPMLTLAVYLAIRALGGEPSRWLWPLLAVSTLVRLDMAIPALTILALVAWFDAPRRRSHLVHGGGMLLLFLGVQLLAAWWYFGNPLPNTYYLKMTGYPVFPRLAHGSLMTARFLMHLEPVTLGLIATVLWLKRDAMGALLGAVFLAQIAYNIYVGGDAWEQFGGANRYLVIAMPLFMILLATTLQTTAHGLASLVGAVTAPRDAGWTGAAVFCVLALACSGTLSATGTYQNRSDGALRVLFLVDRPPEYVDHLTHLKRALLCDQFTDHDASIAVVWAGVVPYFADRNAIDLLGKNDALIAHEPMHIDPFLDFYPGHMKWDYGYSIGTLKPDIVMELWHQNDEVILHASSPYGRVLIDGHAWYFRNDSRHIRWPEVEALRDPSPFAGLRAKRPRP